MPCLTTDISRLTTDISRVGGDGRPPVAPSSAGGEGARAAASGGEGGRPAASAAAGRSDRARASAGILSELMKREGSSSGTGRHSDTAPPA